MPNPLDLERVKAYCDWKHWSHLDSRWAAMARTDLPAAVAEIAELRAQLEVARAEKLSLWCGLQKAHDMMVTWFSSEYADSPKAHEIRKLIDAHRPE